MQQQKHALLNSWVCIDAARQAEHSLAAITVYASVAGLVASQLCCLAATSVVAGAPSLLLLSKLQFNVLASQLRFLVL
jgi:hypothetical protein